MGRFTWIAGLVLCVGLADRQTASGQPLIHVLLVDQAEVPPDTRQLAQDVAMRVFHLSGLALVWVDAGTCPARCLTVRIVTEPVTAQSRRDPHILGVAPSMPEARGINFVGLLSPHQGTQRGAWDGRVTVAGPCDGPRVGSSVAAIRRPFACRFDAGGMGSRAGASRRRGPVDLYTGSGRPDTRGAASFRFAYCAWTIASSSYAVCVHAISFLARRRQPAATNYRLPPTS